jgi:hypothetical protein
MCVAVLAAAGTAAAGEVVTKAADKLTLSGYTQAAGAYRDDVPDSLVNNSIFLKRARVKLDAEITSHTKSELELDFVSSKMVKDAWLGISPTPAFTLQIGQYKRPFSQEELFSSSALPVVDLGLTNLLATTRLGYSGRSQGIMGKAMGKGGKFEAMAGVFTGAGEGDLATGDKLLGKQTDINNRGKDWAARLGTALGEAPRLHLAANVSSRSVGGNYTDGAAVAHKAATFLAYGGDAELKQGGLTLWAEALTGDNFSAFTDTMSNFSAPTFLGWHVAGNFQKAISGEHLFTAWQLEGRFEMFDPDLDASSDGSSQITGGVALFLGKNMRWRTDAEWTTFQSSTSTALRLVSELQAKI